MWEECGYTSGDGYSSSEDEYGELTKSLSLIQKIQENASVLKVTKQEIQYKSPKNDPDTYAPSAYEENPIPPEPTLQPEPMGTTPSLDHHKAAKEKIAEDKKVSFKRCLTADGYRALVSTIDYSPAREAQIRKLLMGFLFQDTQENGYDYIASILTKVPYYTMLDFFDFFYTSDNMGIELAKAYIRGASATHVHIMAMIGMSQKIAESMTSCNVLASKFKEIFKCFITSHEQGSS